MKKGRGGSMLVIVLPLILALLSIFVVSKYASSPEFHAETIESLDEKKSTVMELAAASTAASAAITLIPGDTATPIAEKLADFSGYFLIVLCAIYLEKYLVTLTGYASFVVLIPAACVLLSAFLITGKQSLGTLAKKLAIFGAAIVLVIPASVKVSNIIENTYEESIQTTLAEAQATTEEIEENTDEEESGWSNWFSSVKDGVSGIKTKVENVLNHFIEALAVMIVTSCVIPIVVLIFFVWLVKLALGIEGNVPKLPMKQ